MTATTEERTKRGTRGRRDRPSRVRRARHGATTWSAAEHAEAAARAAEISLRSWRAAEEPGAREAYARRVRARLLEEISRVGSLESGAVALAYSRTAVATWKGSGLHPEDAAAVRLRVVEEERERLGVAPLRGDSLVQALGAGAWLEDGDGDDLRVPPGRALPGARHRRGGRR